MTSCCSMSTSPVRTSFPHWEQGLAIAPRSNVILIVKFRLPVPSGEMKS